MKTANIKVAIMAGGTGGHIFPGLAVAKELINQGVKVVWLGAVGGMEEKLVKQHNIPIKLLEIKGLRGKGLKGLIAMPFKLIAATRNAAKYFKQEKINSVLSMGGYVAAPGGLAARFKKIPLIVHEQNSKFGMTNKYLSKWAKKVLTGFNLKGLYSSVWLGNPVRDDIENCQRIKNTSQKVNIFILGGSLGANSLNMIVPELLQEHNNIVVKHQCGRNNKQKTLSNYSNNPHVEVFEFIDDMKQMYAWADLVIARAGALTIAEINAVGLPAIFVPYPYAVDDHQTSNARNVVDNKAGFIWQETQDQDSLLKMISELIDNEALRNEMSTNSKSLHKEHSAKKVAEICMGMVA